MFETHACDTSKNLIGRKKQCIAVFKRKDVKSGKSRAPPLLPNLTHNRFSDVMKNPDMFRPCTFFSVLFRPLDKMFHKKMCPTLSVLSSYLATLNVTQRNRIVKVLSEDTTNVTLQQGVESVT